MIDPIEDLARIGAEASANVHVDACMGGFVLPFMERLGEDLPLWDFRVPGVTTISLDVHKLGYAPKGASIILHRDKASRRFQTYTFDAWRGGFYASPSMQGTRSGAPMAAAWAVMHRLGLEGYEQLTRTAIDTARKIQAGVPVDRRHHDRREPQAQILAIGSTTAGTRGSTSSRSVKRLAVVAGISTGRTIPMPMHATVQQRQCAGRPDSHTDLADAVAETLGTTTDDRDTAYATVD